MSGPYQQGPYQQGPYQPAAGGYGFPPPGRPARYTPGFRLVVALAGLVSVALSLIKLSWVTGNKGGFTDISSAARKAGSGAWLGVLGYLAVLASTIVGARRVPA